jgi:hypothetical protein
MNTDDLKKETPADAKPVLAEGLNSEQKAMIEDVTVFSLLQKYDDGRPDKVWTIGDKTKDGVIVSFAKGTGDYWYALTDTPSEWQKERGQKNGWSWIFQLEAVS